MVLSPSARSWMNLKFTLWVSEDKEFSSTVCPTPLSWNHKTVTEVQLLCYVSCNNPTVSLKDFLLYSAPETHLHFPVHSILYHKGLLWKDTTGVCWWVVNCARTSPPDHTLDHRCSLANCWQGRFLLNEAFCYKKPDNEGTTFGTPLCC